MTVHPAPPPLHRCGLRQAVRNRPADTEVVLPEGLLSTLYLEALIEHLPRSRSPQENPE
jgi:hypothetical protein